MWLPRIRNAKIGFLYRWLLKPIFFAQDPERVHDHMIATGHRLGRIAVTRALTRLAFGYSHPSLRTTVAGLRFNNPVGLSAGFDKQAEVINIIPRVGFGFMEIGSVTGTPGPGNPKPRLWRLPKSKSLAVHYGLNSIGSQAAAERVRAARRDFPLGINIAKANLPQCDDIDAGIADYRRAARDLAPLADYITINISCPNTTGGEPFTDPDHLRKLLAELMPDLRGKPAFIKLLSDRRDAESDALTDVAMEFPIAGFIISNLAKRREHLVFHDTNIPAHGGISGKVLEKQSNELLVRVRRRYGSKIALIGVGGIFTADDAYRKIKLGASLVQLFTGMIYRGPQTVSTINMGLVRLLKRDGYSNIAGAVGVDA